MLLPLDGRVKPGRDVNQEDLSCCYRWTDATSPTI